MRGPVRQTCSGPHRDMARLAVFSLILSTHVLHEYLGVCVRESGEEAVHVQPVALWAEHNICCLLHGLLS